MLNKIKIIIAAIIITGGVLFGLYCANKGAKTINTSNISKEAICPVTKEKFKITPHTPFVEYKNTKYYFCCPGCDKKFLSDPEKYIETKDTTGTEQRTPTNEIVYWTCSMHPTVRSDKPGDCPICGMDLIPVYKTNENRIIIDEKIKTALNIITQPAKKMMLIKKIHVPGRVAKDEELYLVQQGYISVYQLGGNLLESAKLRLKLLGFSDVEIEHLVHLGKPDESLIYPSPHRVWVFAEIYERDLSLVKTGQKTNVKFVAYPNKIFTGTIKAIELIVNPQTRSAKARITIEHPMKELRFDMFGDVEIFVNLGNRLSVPYSSIIDTGTRKIIYVEVADNQYEPRPIETGFETDEYVQVIKGLKEGNRVVTEGNFLLDSQTTLAGGQSLLYGGAEEIKETKPPTMHQH